VQCLRRPQPDPGRARDHAGRIGLHLGCNRIRSLLETSTTLTSNPAGLDGAGTSRGQTRGDRRSPGPNYGQAGAQSIELGGNCTRLRPTVQAGGGAIELAPRCGGALLVPEQGGGSIRLCIGHLLDAEPKTGISITRSSRGVAIPCAQLAARTVSTSTGRTVRLLTSSDHEQKPPSSRFGRPQIASRPSEWTRRSTDPSGDFLGVWIPNQIDDDATDDRKGLGGSPKGRCWCLAEQFVIVHRKPAEVVEAPV
jgi:hypothetical protein